MRGGRGVAPSPLPPSFGHLTLATLCGCRMCYGSSLFRHFWSSSCVALLSVAVGRRSDPLGTRGKAGRAIYRLIPSFPPPALITHFVAGAMRPRATGGTSHGLGLPISNLTLSTPCPLLSKSPSPPQAFLFLLFYFILFF